MKQVILMVVFVLSSTFVFAQSSNSLSKKPDPNKKTLTLEAACGQCLFGMEGHGCDLAVKIEGKTYYVVGTHIDSHGDAHAKDGFCQAIRKAEVQGEVKDGKFVVSYFKLLRKK